MSKKNIKKQPIDYKKILSKNFFIIIFVLIFGLISFYFSRKFLIVATVNGKSISRLTVIKTLEKQAGKKTLENLIVKSLILQEANKRKINVSQKDIDNEIKKIKSNLSSQGMTLDQALKSQGMTKNDLVKELKTQLTLQKMAGNNIKISKKEIDDFIKKNKDHYPDKKISRNQAVAQLKQQKTQQNIQKFLANLKAKAKITYFVNY